MKLDDGWPSCFAIVDSTRISTWPTSTLGVKWTEATREREMAPFATNSSFHLCSNTSCTQLTVWHALGCNASVVVHFLQFALTAIHGSEEHWKAGKDWEHSSHEWLQDDIWGVGSNHKGLNTERASCLECLESGLTSGVLKPSQTDHELIQELLNRLQAPTSYVPLTSTWHHSCHECSKPFPDFHYSSASVDYCQCKLKKKMGVAWEWD